MEGLPGHTGYANRPMFCRVFFARDAGRIVIDIKSQLGGVETYSDGSILWFRQPAMANRASVAFDRHARGIAGGRR